MIALIVWIPTIAVGVSPHLSVKQEIQKDQVASNQIVQIGFGTIAQSTVEVIVVVEFVLKIHFVFGVSLLPDV